MIMDVSIETIIQTISLTYGVILGIMFLGCIIIYGIIRKKNPSRESIEEKQQYFNKIFNIMFNWGLFWIVLFGYGLIFAFYSIDARLDYWFFDFFNEYVLPVFVICIWYGILKLINPKSRINLKELMKYFAIFVFALVLSIFVAKFLVTQIFPLISDELTYNSDVPGNTADQRLNLYYFLLFIFSPRSLMYILATSFIPLVLAVLIDAITKDILRPIIVWIQNKLGIEQNTNNRREKKNVRKVVAVFLICIISGALGYSAYYIIQEVKYSNIQPDITISTMGDSLTDSGYYGNFMKAGVKNDNWYQYYSYQYLNERGIESSIYNLGISGQITSEICGRFNDSVPADYIVSMAGTNDLWRADYSNPNINDELADLIINQYNDTIFNTIQYQLDEGGVSPIIIICSIPPITDWQSSMAQGIIHVNGEIEQYVENLNMDDVLFCDVHESMRNSDYGMIDGLATGDGVHFTKMGKLVCGEAIAETIATHYYQ